MTKIRKFLNIEVSSDEFLEILFKNTVLQGEIDDKKLHEILKLQGDDGSEHILIHDNLKYGFTDYLGITRKPNGEIRFVLFTPCQEKKGE